MKYYAGLDVSNKSTAVCVMNERREVISEFSVKSYPQDIFEALVKTKLNIEAIGLESGFISHYLTLGLKERGLNVVCLDARKVAGILAARVNKTDKNDARGICEILQSGFLHGVHHKSEESMQLGTCLQARDVIVRNKISLINSIRGLLRVYGVRIETSRKDFGTAVIKAVETLAVPIQAAIIGLLTILKESEKQLSVLEERLAERAEELPEVELLMTVPGVGPITALAFLAELDTASRFKSSRSVGAFLGLTPRQYSSGEIQRQGSISKQGSPMMRSLLVGAAMLILSRVKSWSKLKAWGLKILKKHGKKKAAVAVARKLAIILHRMLVMKAAFRPGEPKQKESSTKDKDTKPAKVAQEETKRVLAPKRAARSRACAVL